MHSCPAILSKNFCLVIHRVETVSPPGVLLVFAKETPECSADISRGRYGREFWDFVLTLDLSSSTPLLPLQPHPHWNVSWSTVYTRRLLSRWEKINTELKIIDIVVHSIYSMTVHFITPAHHEEASIRVNSSLLTRCLSRVISITERRTASFKRAKICLGFFCCYVPHVQNSVL